MPDEIKCNIEIYEEFIHNLCQFFENIGISKEPIKIYETFRYMYLNGYLSSEKYSDNIPNSFIKLESGYIPMDVAGSMIMANYGVCRHTTDFLSHIYCGLNYESSQLFLYVPDTRIIVRNRGKEIICNYDAQKYIDNAIQELDLFSKEKVHIKKKYGDIVVTINYYPSEGMPNHTVNIVKKRTENCTCILDTRSHCIGDKNDGKTIILNDLGLTHMAFVDQNPIYHTYYDTDYHYGLWLLNTFDTQVNKDILKSILCRDHCKDYEDEFKAFKGNNQKKLNLVNNNFQRLIKRKL